VTVTEPEPESSPATTVTVTGWSDWLGGHSVFGLALQVIVGGVVSETVEVSSMGLCRIRHFWFPRGSRG
jgi:hypothetical protein